MTAAGQLYFEEDCRDTFKKDLDRVFGEDKWCIEAQDHSDCYDPGDVPDVATVNIRNEYNDEKIGEATIYTEFKIEGDGRDKYIDAIPDKIQIKRITRTK